MRKRGIRALSAFVLVFAMIAGVTIPGAARGIDPGQGGDGPIFRHGTQSNAPEEDEEEQLLDRDLDFIAGRTAGTSPLSVAQAGKLRGQAAKAMKAAIVTAPSGSSFASAWTALGPNPTLQRAAGGLTPRSGRIGALAIRANGQFILGGAQGGIWLFNAATGRWVAKTDQLPSLAIGALAVAPSNDLVVYAGTGEGALSGDSYFGNGILKSTDGGNTWSQVSGDYFVGVSTSRLAVDPTNANHLYASISRGRGGVRRTSPPIHSTYGIWESTDGAVTWTLRMAAPPAGSLGATDVRLDPQSPSILYASFWSDKIYKSTNGGLTWAPIMNGFPANANFAGVATRFALAVSHPAGTPPVVYAGFDWNDTGGVHHTAKVWRTNDEGANWFQLSTTTDVGSVSNYCGGQCFYDNVIEADPSDSNIVYAGGQVSGAGGGGAFFRSDDGGQTWKNLSFNQHADFHAMAFNPSDPAQVLIGNDGGVSFSADRGGRHAGEPITDNTWESLDGRGLQITQFTSIATVPQVPAGANSERFWGGTQDNGTQRKSVNSQNWFDVAGGDGGQVLVDQTDQSTCAPLFTKGCFVYGTYFNISPYRITDAGGAFFANQSIVNGINTTERSEFYVPYVLNQLKTNQLFLGTYRLYRTDNAKEELAGDVTWTPISPDLTTGCIGPAPNGARNCTLSAIGVGGGTAVYTGSNDGLVYFSSDGQVSLNPTWTRIGASTFPGRPVASIAVDRSNYRVAYFAFNGFDAATPGRPGHIWKTSDGGQTFKNITKNLPDTPVNSLVIDPALADTIYIGTDIGPFVSYNGGGKWYAMGTGFPIVAIDQIDLDPYHRIMAAGTHGRGAWRLQDTASTPSLVITKADAGVPVGPGSNLDYTLTVFNIGNANATGVTITDPVPANTTFVSADQGGQLEETVRWSGKSIPAGGSISVHVRFQVSPSLSSSVKALVNDGFRASDKQGQKVDGSPTVTPIAPPFAVKVTPSAQTGGSQAGGSQTYNITVKNMGFTTDSYNLSSTSGAFGVSFYDAPCTTAQSSTPSLIAGATADVCVKVSVPSGTADGTTETTTVKATSVASPGTSTASANITTIAVTVETLLVDNDGNVPDVQSYYRDALTAAGVAFDVWDLSAHPTLPIKYMQAFKHIVWFTGNSYPGPIQPYERNLTAYLNGGGQLFVSGHDLLDQAAGTTAFVRNYLHVTWDGSETQNDKETADVHGVAGSLTNGVGAVPLDHNVLGAAFEDQITPNGGASPIFTDDTGATDALSFSGGGYKVVFLAFPLEAYGSAAQKADLVSRVFTFFVS